MSGSTDIYIRVASGVTLKLVLQRVRPGYYLLVSANKDKTVYGHIYRRNSWRLHDWRAEFAYEETYASRCEGALYECFHLLPLRYARDVRDAKADKVVAHQMAYSAKRLRYDLSAGGRVEKSHR